MNTYDNFNDMDMIDFEMRVFCIWNETPGCTYEQAAEAARDEIKEERLADNAHNPNFT
jgi:hypothetical protein